MSNSERGTDTLARQGGQKAQLKKWLDHPLRPPPPPRLPWLTKTCIVAAVTHEQLGALEDDVPGLPIEDASSVSSRSVRAPLGVTVRCREATFEAHCTLQTPKCFVRVGLS